MRRCMECDAQRLDNQSHIQTSLRDTAEDHERGHMQQCKQSSRRMPTARSMIQGLLKGCSSSKVTATTAFAESLTFSPSTSATSPKSIK